MMDELNKNFPINSYSELPDDLHVSYDSGKNPWQNLFMQDFILVAEFSEHEGPRPLFSVPEAAGEVFDKNAFAVHVMSVDYQTHTNSAFSLVDDTQLVFSEDRENIFAYVHHFILYDIEARGFVRPFCMCYISNSKKKILSNLENFIQECSKISKHFKSFNKPIFHDDLNQRLADLAYVKDCLQAGCQSEQSDRIKLPKNETKDFHGLNNETIDSMLAETTNAVKVVETDKLISNVVRNGYEKIGVSESKFGTGHCQVATECIAKKDDGAAKDVLEETEASYLHDASNCHSFNEEQSHDEVTQRLLRERRRHLLTLRDLDELCGFHAMEGVACLQKLHKHFYQPFEVFSVVKEETSLLDPFFSVFTIGGSFEMNFLKDIHQSSTEQSSCGTGTTVDSFGSGGESFKSCYDEDEQRQEISQNDGELTVYSCFRPVTNEDLLGEDDFCSTCSSDDVPDTTILTNPANCSAYNRQSSQHSQHENETDSLKTVTTTAVNIAHYGTPVSHHGLSARKHSRSTSDLSSFTNRPPRSYQRYFSAIETRGSFFKDLSRNVPFTLDITPRDISHSWDDVKHPTALCSTPQYRVIYNYICQDGDPDRVPACDRFDRVFVQCYVQQLRRRKADGPGGGILRVFRNYSYLVHLLYALLRGRMVIVLAEPCHKRDVRSLITALWLFVPGRYRECQRVVLWRTKPIKLTDLERLKLVGLSKSKQFNILPNSVETYITTLDFESGCLKTPPYQGEFLNEMLASRYSWKDDALFLAHIQSVFLDMSLKSFVCYFASIFRSPSEDGNLSWRQKSLVSRDLSVEYMRDILDDLGILGSDAHIILYFLDVITQQQLTNVSPTASQISGCCDHVTKTRPISLDFAQRLTYKKSADHK